MDSSDSLQLDEHLARLLAAYDQGIGDADGKAQTLDFRNSGGASSDKPSGNSPANEGPLDELLPDSRHPGPQTPLIPPQPPSGTHRVGRFELRRQLGKGGCGIVFLAYDPRLQREVALKIPRPEMLLSSDARRRLIREAQAAAEFDHPNLVPVYETGEIGPVCFIATAFCPGQTLAEWLDRQAFPIPVRQVARLVATVAEAVQHAHDRGVLHRDLKPNNVILQVVNADPNANEGPPLGSCPLRGDHFLPRVVDFGLAKLAERGPSDTATRQILGTPKYMAPEQAQGRRDDVGPQADVYALGVILYEMLAGRAPYDGPTDVEVLRQAIDGNLTPPRALRKDIPRDLEAICLKAMSRVPTNRYRTAIDLADDLRRFLDGLPTLARPLKLLGRTARWVRRNDQWFALGVVTTIALVLLPIGFWGVHQARQAKDAQENYQREQRLADMRREYTRHVRDAFLSWRSGDAKQMTDSLANAQMLAQLSDDEPEFAWGYLSQLGRVEKLSVPCPAGAVAALAVSADGRRIATGHPDGTLAVWDRDTGALIGSIKAHPAELTHLAFLNSGSALVTVGGERVARTWTVAPDGSVQAAVTMPPFAAVVSCLSASPDGKFVYVGSNGGECLCWDATIGRAVRLWHVTTDTPVEAITVSPDGKTLATAGAGSSESVRLWDAATGAPVGEIRGAGGASLLTTIPTADGAWLLAAADRADGTVRLFEREGRELRTLPGHAGPIRALATSPDGSLLATGGQDDSVCIWEVSTGSIRTLLRGHEKPVRGVRFGLDGKSLFSASEDGLLKVWDLTADPEGQAVRGLPAAVRAVAIQPNDREFAVAFADGSVELYTGRGAPPRRFPGDGHGPLSVLKYRPGRPPVGVELVGRSVICWEFGTERRALLRAELPDGTVATAADLSSEGGRLAVGDDRGRVSMWAIDGGTMLGSFASGLPTPVRVMSLSDDGRWVAAQTAGHAVGVWEVGGESKLVSTVYGHGEGLWLIRFLPEGTRLATAGRGGSIRVWNLAPAREELSLLGHVGQVTRVAISPDGRTLVSGTSTGEVKLWDLRTGQELITLRRHSGPVTAAEFAPGGKLLLTGGTTAGGRGELAFWDAAGRE